MEKTGYIEIRITGSHGNIPLSPETYDIREIKEVLEKTENLLYPGEKKERPLISYKIEEGSVRHIFKTSLQYIIGFNALIGSINQSQTIDFLDAPTARAIEEFQDTAVKKNYTFTLSTSVLNSNEIIIDRTTHFQRTELVWADAEFYFYGKVTNAGGKEKANIHIYTEDQGIIRVETPISFLETYDDNMLYKTFGIRAKGKQHTETGEIDKSTLQFLEMVEYQPKYDDRYLTSLRNKAKKNWLGALKNPDGWLRELRGGYDA
ncbi:MAG: hypothetical protein Q8L88_05330 [Bacteroidota bacterium]|nr:hypothetical protein [Bacteroidota bacterium]